MVKYKQCDFWKHFDGEVTRQEMIQALYETHYLTELAHYALHDPA